MKRNWEGLVLKALGGKDFRLTVLASEPVKGSYQRIFVDGGGLLDSCDPHPTMWIRLWFDNEGRPHQRAYTIVDPEPSTGRFSLEFAIHDGVAARWATSAAEGDTIEATVQGSSFALPTPAPAHLYVIGDPASLPAVNSLLDAAASIPATIWLEYSDDDDQALPVRMHPDHSVIWVPRADGGKHLVDVVSAAIPAAQDAFYWVACEAGTTRSINRHLRKVLGVDKRRVASLGYWTAT